MTIGSKVVTKLLDQDCFTTMLAGAAAAATGTTGAGTGFGAGVTGAICANGSILGGGGAGGIGGGGGGAVSSGCTVSLAAGAGAPNIGGISRLLAGGRVGTSFGDAASTVDSGLPDLSIDSLSAISASVLRWEALLSTDISVVLRDLPQRSRFSD